MNRLAWILALLAAIPCGFAAAEAQWLPVELEDPSTGGRTELKAGPAALHLVLFATWCPACLAELDELAELESRWGPDGYRLVLIAVATRHTGPKLARFVEQRRPPGMVLLDGGGLVEKALDAPGLPTHVLLDGRGREVLRSSALDKNVKLQIEQLVRRTRGRAGG